MPLKVIVLAHHSLFAHGLARCLAERSDIFEVQLLESEQADVAQQSRQWQPLIVVMDALDAELAQTLPVANVLEIVPEAKIIRLDCNSDHVQIISGARQRAGRFGEFVDVLQHLGPQAVPLF